MQEDTLKGKLRELEMKFLQESDSIHQMMEVHLQTKMNTTT